MSHLQAALQDREIVNAQTARQFHLNAINHLQKALASHREAVDSHDQGDFAKAAQNATQAQVHLSNASTQTASATKHYWEQMSYR